MVCMALSEEQIATGHGRGPPADGASQAQPGVSPLRNPAQWSIVTSAATSPRPRSPEVTRVQPQRSVYNGGQRTSQTMNAQLPRWREGKWRLTARVSADYAGSRFQ
ncbi:hypothetical protein AAFF_G00314380 [Aldrovandia affinis]|uniref:Uncharacterized protein n=1 Tax=Aldrovandia affinis TaxID=143900 RepID=A0AAD7W0M0_9TELE|nr:hypothetical protein AAFF_G00314380 [Aldrovandia affinis]